MIGNYISDSVKEFTMIITPEIASKILEEHNTNNRSIRGGEVKLYADEMKQGRWIFEGTPIRFVKDGTLADGQHRLSAVVMSGIPQKFSIIVGLDNDARLVMDTGARRRVIDNLRMGGSAEYNNTIISGIGMCYGSFNRGHAIGTIETKMFVDRYKSHIDNIAEYFYTVHKGTTKGCVVCAMLLASIAGENFDIIKGFLNTLYNGNYIGVSKGEASVYVLRDWLKGNINIRSKKTIGEEIKVVQRVYEAYKNGVSLSKIYVPKDYTYPLLTLDELEV